MSLEQNAFDALQTLMEAEDSFIEEHLDELKEMLTLSGDMDQAIVEKRALCRAEGLTTEDLLEENALIAKTREEAEELDLSETKRNLLQYILDVGTQINDAILATGLHEKANLRIEYLDHAIEKLAYAHDGDSGLDVRLSDDIIVPPKGITVARTGLRAVIPKGYELQVRPRSGISSNPDYLYLFIGNSPATIDSGYRGEINIILKNLGEDPLPIAKGTKIAQMVLAKVVQAQLISVEDVAEFETTRMESGFGSTGER